MLTARTRTLSLPGNAERGVKHRMSEVRLKKGESVERALRRLKKKLDREGTLREIRNHRHYEKPSEKKRRKSKGARYGMSMQAAAAAAS